MRKIKEINIISYAKLQALILGLFGIIVGILYSGLGAIYDVYHDNISYGTALAFIAIPLMPVYFAVFGYISGVIGGYIFNRTSGFFGGIKVKIEK